MISQTNDLNQIVVCDCDEVLVNITPKWYNKIYESINTFVPYFIKHNTPLGPMEVLMRDKYYLNEWLKTKSFDELPERKKELVIRKMLELYYNDKTFYDDLAPTTFGSALSITLYNTIFMKKLIILTHSFPQNVESKNNFLMKYFTDKSVEIVNLDMNTSKNKWLEENLPAWDIFIDDNLDIIKEVAKENKKKKFIMPAVGYSKLTDEDVIFFIENGHIIQPYKKII